jgi:hypothetical protein
MSLASLCSLARARLWACQESHTASVRSRITDNAIVMEADFVSQHITIVDLLYGHLTSLVLSKMEDGSEMTSELPCNRGKLASSIWT